MISRGSTRFGALSAGLSGALSAGGASGSGSSRGASAAAGGEASIGVGSALTGGGVFEEQATSSAAAAPRSTGEVHIAHEARTDRSVLSTGLRILSADRGPWYAREIMRLTLCGSLSLHPVGTGAAMHLAGYRALGLPFTYVPFGITDLAGAISGMRALGLRGLGISMPWKQDVIPLLDAIEPTAARIGAVNTVVNDDGKLTGHNTDWLGAVRALEEIGPLAGRRVLLLGGGGAARAVAFGLHERGATLVLANRSPERIEGLATELGVAVRGLEETENLSRYDIVVNATSVGMATGGDTEGQCPVPMSTLRSGLVVMDIVYKPLVTPLVERARACGATAIAGGRMLLHQAAAQFQLYTGRDAPLDAMERALAEQLA